MCADDPVAASLVPRIARPVVTYGIESDADVRAVNIVRARHADALRCAAARLAGAAAGAVESARHAQRAQLARGDRGRDWSWTSPIAAIQAALANFHGVDRRLQQYGDVQTAAGRVTLIDDYGHHPTELAATLEAIRQGWPERRIVLAFQPHRYTRTRDLLDDFARVLASVDALIVTEVYAAGEAPIAGADGKAICRAIRSHGRVEPVFVEKIEDLPRALIQIARDGDVIVTMGAGSIGAAAAELPARCVAASAVVERRRP